MTTFVPPRIQSLYRPSKRPSLSLTMSLTNKGLLNPTGENNCFLNAAVQVLWHIDVFRRSFRGFEGHSCVGKSCIFCALKVLFTQFQYGSQSSIPPDVLRRAMAECYQEQHRFQLGWMDDAAECFEKLLEQIHFHLTGSDDLDSCSEEFCLPHQKFAFSIMERMVCRCGATSEPLAFVQFIHYISTPAIITEARKLGPAPSSSPHGSSVFGTLLKRASTAGEYRECSDSGCRRMAILQRVLLNCPDVVCFGLIWDFDQPSVEYIKGVISTIGLTIKLADVFDQLTSPQAVSNEYHLTGVVAYYGRHYSTFSYHSTLREWVYFDDAKFRKVGPQWSTVVQQCYKAHYQPLLLVYTNPQARVIELSKSPQETRMIPCDHRGGGRGGTARPLSTLVEEEESDSQASTPANQITAPPTTSSSAGALPTSAQATNLVSSSGHTTGIAPPLQTAGKNQLPVIQQQNDVSRDLMEFSINPVGVTTPTTTPSLSGKATPTATPPLAATTTPTTTPSLATKTTPTATPTTTPALAALKRERTPPKHFDPSTQMPLAAPTPPSTSESFAVARPKAQVTPKLDALPAADSDLILFSLSPAQVSTTGREYSQAPPSKPHHRGSITVTAEYNTAASQGLKHATGTPPLTASRPSNAVSNQVQPGVGYQPLPPQATGTTSAGYRPTLASTVASNAFSSQPQPGVGYQQFPPPATSVGYRPTLASTVASNAVSSQPRPGVGYQQLPPPATSVGYRPTVPATTASNAVSSQPQPGVGYQQFPPPATSVGYRPTVPATTASNAVSRQPRPGVGYQRLPPPATSVGYRPTVPATVASNAVSNQGQPGVGYQRLPPPATGTSVGYGAVVSNAVANQPQPRVGYQQLPPPVTSTSVGYRPALPATTVPAYNSSAVLHGPVTIVPSQQATTRPEPAAIGFEGLLPQTARPIQGGEIPFRAPQVGGVPFSANQGGGIPSRATPPGYTHLPTSHGRASNLPAGRPSPTVQNTYPSAPPTAPPTALPTAPPTAPPTALPQQWTGSNQVPFGMATPQTQQAKWERFESPHPADTRPASVSGNQPQSLPEGSVPRPVPSSAAPSLSTQFTSPAAHPPLNGGSDPFSTNPGKTKSSETKAAVHVAQPTASGKDKDRPPESSSSKQGFMTQGHASKVPGPGSTPPIGGDPLYAVPSQVLQRQALAKALVVAQPQTGFGAASNGVSATSRVVSTGVTSPALLTDVSPSTGGDPLNAVPGRSQSADRLAGISASGAEHPHSTDRLAGMTTSASGVHRREYDVTGRDKVATAKPSDVEIPFGAHSTPPIGNDPLYAVPVKPAAKLQSGVVPNTNAGRLHTPRSGALPHSGGQLRAPSDFLTRSSSVGSRPLSRDQPSVRGAGSGRAAAVEAPAFQSLPTNARTALMEAMAVWSKAETTVGTDRALALVLFTQALGLLQKVLQDPAVQTNPALYQQVHGRKEVGVAKCRELRAQIEPTRPKQGAGKSCVRCGRVRTSLDEQSICGPCQLKMKVRRM